MKVIVSVNDATLPAASRDRQGPDSSRSSHSDMVAIEVDVPEEERSSYASVLVKGLSLSNPSVSVEIKSKRDGVDSSEDNLCAHKKIRGADAHVNEPEKIIKVDLAPGQNVPSEPGLYNYKYGAKTRSGTPLIHHRGLKYAAVIAHAIRKKRQAYNTKKRQQEIKRIRDQKKAWKRMATTCMPPVKKNVPNMVKKLSLIHI